MSVSDEKADARDHLGQTMVRVRVAQIMLNDMIGEGDFKIPVHLALGHEAIAAAVDAVMDEDDQLLLTHRNIHYNLARHDAFAREVAEYKLQADGIAGGTLGAMNLFNPDANIPYTSSILANNLPIAAGMALAQQIETGKGVCFVVTGDGAIEEGAFYESLLLYAALDLPIIVIVENNGWSLGTTIDERRKAIDLENLTAAIGGRFQRLSGNDAGDYFEILSDVRLQARLNGQVQVLEVAVTTLGDWRMPTPDHPDGKFINYHAGHTPAVAGADNLVIREDASDPLYILAEQTSADLVGQWASTARRNLEAQLS